MMGIRKTATKKNGRMDHGDSKRAASLYARLGSESKSEVWMSLDQGFGVYEV